MTSSPSHVVLGSNGVAGRETLRALLASGHTAASVNRPAITDGAVSVMADLLDPAGVLGALRGARVAAGRTATWLLDADQPHSLTYTPDIGDALAILGTAAAPGRTWHLPTAPALTGSQYVGLGAGTVAPVSSQRRRRQRRGDGASASRRRGDRSGQRDRSYRNAVAA